MATNGVLNAWRPEQKNNIRPHWFLSGNKTESFTEPLFYRSLRRTSPPKTSNRNRTTHFFGSEEIRRTLGRLPAKRERPLSSTHLKIPSILHWFCIRISFHPWGGGCSNWWFLKAIIIVRAGRTGAYGRRNPYARRPNRTGVTCRRAPEILSRRGGTGDGVITDAVGVSLLLTNL